MVQRVTPSVVASVEPVTVPQRSRRVTPALVVAVQWASPVVDPAVAQVSLAAVPAASRVIQAAVLTVQQGFLAAVHAG